MKYWKKFTFTFQEINPWFSTKIINKSKVFSIFQIFKSLVENESGKKNKTLRLDNGGEFVKNEFKAFLSKHGIQHQKTVPTHLNKMVLLRGKTKL